jgi:hypothetical protein
MSAKGWILALVGGGVVVAIVLGLVGQSQPVAEKRFCNSLAGLQSSVQSLKGLTPATASQGDVQSAVSGIQSAWSDVRSDAQDLNNANLGALEGSWNDFVGALGSVPSSASAGDAAQAISSAAKGLQSTVQSNIKSYDCANT